MERQPSVVKLQQASAVDSNLRHTVAELRQASAVDSNRRHPHSSRARTEEVVMLVDSMPLVQPFVASMSTMTGPSTALNSIASSSKASEQ